MGTVVEHGSSPQALLLRPGETVRIGDVAGWEWDGYVGITLTFRDEGASTALQVSYDLKRGGGGPFTIERTGAEGRIVPPGRTRVA